MAIGYQYAAGALLGSLVNTMYLVLALTVLHQLVLIIALIAAVAAKNLPALSSFPVWGEGLAAAGDIVIPD